MRSLNTFLVCLLCLLITGPATAAPEEEDLGKSKGYPSVGSMATHVPDFYKVGSMTNMENVYKPVAVKASGEVRQLVPMQNPPAIRFFANGYSQGLDQLLSENRITGLLLMKDGQIVAERYQYDRKPEHKFTSYSMAKTIVGILVGAALKDGYIKSLDDTADTYVKDLKGADYGKVTIRNLLHMSSGIQWTEHGKDTGDDVTKLGMQTYKQKGGGGAAAVKYLRASGKPQGTEFNYNSADTYTLGLVLRAASGKSVSEYTTEKIWSRLGAEADASWNVDWSGQETSFAYFNARLRDYGRLAMFVSDGMKDVVSEDYLMEMTTDTKNPEYLKHRKISLYHGYGYQTWFLPYKTRTFAMLGSYGQLIVMQPDTKIVIVMTSVRKEQRSDLGQFKYDIAMIHGMLRSLGGNLEQYPIPH